MLDLATATPTPLAVWNALWSHSFVAAWLVLGACIAAAGIAAGLRKVIDKGIPADLWADSPRAFVLYAVFKSSAAWCIALWVTAKLIPVFPALALIPHWILTAAKIAALCLAVVTVVTYIAGTRARTIHRSGPVGTPGGGDIYDRPSVNADPSNGTVQ